MKFSVEDGKSFWIMLREKFRQWIKQDTPDVGRLASATVISANNIAKTAVVRLLSSPSDGSQDFEVKNQTNNLLAAGDIVWLLHWNEYTNAFIIITNT